MPLHSTFEGIAQVVAEADKAVMDVYNSSDLGIEIKPDNSPITLADKAAHTILLKGLARIMPNIPIVSEEGDERQNRETVKEDQFFLVDPLDGTKEFIARTGEFTVCAALIQNNRPVFGVVSAPAHGTTYYGGQKFGSYRKQMDEKVAKGISVAVRATGIIMISRSHQNRATAEHIAQVYPNHQLEVAGSMLKYTKIAEGLADASPRLNSLLHLWDVAAGHAIVEGAGGSFTTIGGSEIDYQTSDLVVPNFVAHR